MFVPDEGLILVVVHLAHRLLWRQQTFLLPAVSLRANIKKNKFRSKVEFKLAHILAFAFKAVIYCILRVSETTHASSDFYCQSNNDNDTRTSCTFYERSLQVNHRQNTQKERAGYCEVGREGERRDRERERTAWVFIGVSYFWFWPSS